MYILVAGGLSLLRYRSPLEKGVLAGGRRPSESPEPTCFYKGGRTPAAPRLYPHVPPPRLYFKGVPPALDVRRVVAIRGSALCVRAHSLHWLGDTCLIYRAATARRYGIKFDYRFCAKRIGGSL